MRLHRFKIVKINYKAFACALILAFSNLSGVYAASKTTDFSNDPNFACTNIKLVYARESGAELGSLNYERFTDSFLGTFGDDEPSISIYELGTKEGGYDGNSYPSPGIGIETWQRFTTSIGAYISAGESYSYGESVKEGAREAVYFIKNYKKVCPNSKVIMAGYSQGAQVVSLSLQSLDPSLIFAALTFGDPKLYLPEGKLNPISLTTPACSEGKSAHSPYRANVPDCYAYKGILGGYIPYQPSSGYDGKLKAYCQFHDVICSTFVDLDRWFSGHASYKDTGAYTAASQDVYNMYFGIEAEPRKNLAILFDETASMSPMYYKYESDAIKTAEKVFSENGKVALYTFGDLSERGIKKLCDFSTCTAENFKSHVKSIKLSGGDDTPESAFSGAYNMMKEVNWDAGANKNVLIITDAPALNPDRDGITLDDVKILSYEIDPVKIFVLSSEKNRESYQELTGNTNGEFLTDYDEIEHNAFFILNERIDSDNSADTVNVGMPIVSEISNISIDKTSSSSAKLSFSNTGEFAILTINDEIMGYTNTNEIEITDLVFEKDNTICLAPVSSNGYRGETVCKNITSNKTIIIPKAPNTGRK